MFKESVLAMAVLLASKSAFAGNVSWPDLNPAPLPIPDAIYGNPNGCLLAHGDQPEGAALWLTPREIGTIRQQCVIWTWERGTNGTISFVCEASKYLVLSQATRNEKWLVVIELLDRKATSTYLAKCGSE
jgi:hypothetical protein